MRTEEHPGGNGGCRSCTMRNMAATGERLKYGGDPVTNSIIVAPTLLVQVKLAMLHKQPYIRSFRLANHLNCLWAHPIGSSLMGQS